MTYAVVFDVVDAGYQEWSFPVPGGLLATSIAVVLFLSRGIDLGQISRVLKGVMVFATIWMICAFAFTFAAYRSAVNELEKGQFSVVEGAIENYLPVAGSTAPRGLKYFQAFAVDGHQFYLPAPNLVKAISTLPKHDAGNPNGAFARVSFVGDSILKLEIAQ